jgi:hypothetical protein
MCDLAEIGDVMADFEVAERAGTLGVDHAFRNSLSVKVGHLVQKYKVLGTMKLFLEKMTRIGQKGENLANDWQI